MNDNLFGPAAEAVKAAFSDPLNPPAHGGDCPDWLAVFLGAAGLGFLGWLLAAGFR